MLDFLERNPDFDQKPNSSAPVPRNKSIFGVCSRPQKSLPQSSKPFLGPVPPSIRERVEGGSGTLLSEMLKDSGPQVKANHSGNSPEGRPLKRPTLPTPSLLGCIPPSPNDLSTSTHSYWMHFRKEFSTGLSESCGPSD